MTDRADRLRERVGETRVDKRLLALVVLLLLVGLGTGYGTFAFTGGPASNGTTPTATVVEMTPVTATPTPIPGPDGGPPVATTDTETRIQSDTGTATSTDTPADSDDNAESTPTDSDDDIVSTATPRPTATESDSGRSGGGSSDSPDVDLRTVGSTLQIQVSDVAPGGNGTESVVLKNAGADAGRLVVAISTVTDDENSLLEPERAAGDDAMTGELSGALGIRLSVTDSAGTTEYLFGTSSRYVPLADLEGRSARSNESLAAGERATVTLAWQLPARTGNEVQSDRATFDVDLTLRATSD